MNLTIVMVTHDVETLIALSDRVAVLAEQRVIAVGTLNEISHLDHPFIVNFFKNIRHKMDSYHYSEQSWENRAHALIAGVFVIVSGHCYRIGCNVVQSQ